MTNRKFFSYAALSILVLILLPQFSGRQNLQAQSFQFYIDPTIPSKDLLPTQPKSSRQVASFLIKDLSDIPELKLQESLGVSPNEQEKRELIKKVAHQIAKINYINLGKPDRFMELLVENRPDLTGLPFVLGDACRLKKDQSRRFREAALEVRCFFEREILVAPADKAKKLKNLVGENDKENWASIAALMQILAPDLSEMGLGLVEYLSAVKEKDALAALARLVLFADEKNVRSAALKVLKKMAGELTRESDGQELKALLIHGLHYPWPAVAENAAEAVARLKRKDLIPELIGLLEGPDPRSPVNKEIKGKKVPVIRELVRINHHRNCLLCHPPGNTSDITKETLTAVMPVPGIAFSHPLFSPSTVYGSGSPDILVRADVTYLRQDFSRMQKVPDAAPWPEMQRFDFLVRTRILTEAEAKRYQGEFAKMEKSSPYRQAALNALRALTGLDAEPTAAAWRKALAQKNSARK
jgi:hypothetical protein